MFDKVLIANRGEIACRVMATCRRLGIGCVAVYSEADAHAKHVRLADEALCVGPAAARESYLRIDAILEAARVSGAQAIHPGYGFLSENPEFAQRCQDAHLVFIGPPVAAMQAMSSKATAKALMQRCGVPLLPGYHGEDQSTATLAAQAQRIGFPVLIKATAGGGGKGMRVVESAAQFEERLASCQREARQSFGDARVLLERYLQHPRHIEVQVFGDTHGQVLHLFERDCSAQRRHQKVVEEAPAPRMTATLRAALTQAACAAAQAVGYVGAGTVEFLLAQDGEFYFMEMNTRIQVEHPVTEMVTGLDLVEWQLRIAAGEPLPCSQAQIALSGHAIEARLYAEIPEAGFLPSSGTLRRFTLPSPSASVRLESGIENGDSVGIDYDPMLAKLIVHAASRAEAIAALRTALSQVRIEGVGNNVAFLSRLLASEAFRSARIDTGFIEREPQLAAGRSAAPGAVVLAAAALFTLQEQARQQAAVLPALLAHSPWNSTDGWRLQGRGVREADFELLGNSGLSASGAALHVRAQLGEPCALLLEGRWQPAALLAEGHDVYLLQLGDHSQRLRVLSDEGVLQITLGEDSWRLREASVEAGAGQAAETGLSAPMPGRIIAQLSQAGAVVQKGTPLLIMEAMKMEHTICAPADGTVRSYRAAAGEQVKEGAELIEFEPTSAGAA